jgi:methyltransferase
MMTWHFAIVLFIVLQRLAELAYSHRNLARLREAGGIEPRDPAYPGLIVVHTAWVLALAVAVPADAPVDPYFLGLYVAILALRLWVMASLGRFWCTRVVTLPDTPLVRRGPYRFMRHPNYVVVAGEIAVAPLIFGAWELALIFSLLNGACLWLRIRVEERAISGRRALPADI